MDVTTADDSMADTNRGTHIHRNADGHRDRTHAAHRDNRVDNAVHDNH
jgi:hypothetical protein